MKQRETVDPANIWDITGQVISSDIDDLIFPTSAISIPLYNQEYRTHVPLHKYYDIQPRQWGAPDHATVIARLQAILQLEAYKSQSPFPGILELFTHLAKSNEIIGNTARPEIENKDSTLEQLERHLPGIFKGVYHKSPTLSKGQIASDIGAAIHLEDHPHNGDNVAAAGIPVIEVFHYPWSRDWSSSSRSSAEPGAAQQITHACSIPGLIKGEVMMAHPTFALKPAA